MYHRKHNISLADILERSFNRIIEGRNMIHKMLQLPQSSLANFIAADFLTSFLSSTMKVLLFNHCSRKLVITTSSSATTLKREGDKDLSRMVQDCNTQHQRAIVFKLDRVKIQFNFFVFNLVFIRTCYIPALPEQPRP